MTLAKDAKRGALGPNLILWLTLNISNPGPIHRSFLQLVVHEGFWEKCLARPSNSNSVLVNSSENEI